MAVVDRSPHRDEVWLVSPGRNKLDPTQGVEIHRVETKKTRPCLVVSPDEMNQHLRTVIVAPMTTVLRPYPTRVPVESQGKRGQVALDQLRAVDRARLVRKLGKISPNAALTASSRLMEMFSRE